MNATKRTVCLFAIGMCVFAGSSMALDLGGMLKQVEKAVQQMEPEQNKAVQPSTNNTKPQEAFKEVYKEGENAEAPNTAGFCDRVQATDAYQKYAKMIGDAVRGGYYTAGNGSVPLFEASDGLLKKWLLKKRPDYIEHDRAQYSRKYYNIGKKEDRAVVEKCFDQLLPTDFAYVFLYPQEINRLRGLSNNANKDQATTKKVREITDSGEVIEKNIDVPNEELKHYTIMRDRTLFSADGNANNFPHWLALLYGGEKILALSSEDFLKLHGDFLAVEKGKVEAKKVAKNKEAQDSAELLAQIKKGDFSQLKSCAQFANGMDLKIQKNSLSSFFEVLVTPPMTWYYITLAELVKHSDSVGGSEELIKFKHDDNTIEYAKLRLNKKTIVLGEKQRAIGGLLGFVGKYSSNDSVRLTNGATVDIPVYEASCAEYPTLRNLTPSIKD